MTTITPEVSAYLAQFDQRLLATSEGRRLLTRTRPKLFALIYFQAHFHGHLSIPAMHDEWYDQMLEWIKPTGKPAEWRHAYVAPRESAKSTVWFLFAPLWAGAHQHVQFFAGIGNKATGAEERLGDIKKELEMNELLRKDYPELCEPRKNGSYNNSDIEMSNGFIVLARGIDGNLHGMKRGSLRPQVLLFDDIEKGEANYSAHEIAKRLTVIRQDALYLAKTARVVWVGTVTAEGSLIHDLVKTKTLKGETPASWLTEENFKAYYYPAITTNDDGTEQSYWEDKDPLESMLPIRNTRPFQMNMMNAPMPHDGFYWSPEDFSNIFDKQETYPATIISLDPAVTSKTTSDYTGIAVLSFDFQKKLMWVRECIQVKLSPAGLTDRVKSLKSMYPEAKFLLVETNQGGDMWKEQFKDVEIGFKQVHNTKAKGDRASYLAYAYAKGLIKHSKALPQLETQMLSFPAGHDDMIDAVGTGYLYFAPPSQEAPKKVSVRTGSMY